MDNLKKNKLKKKYLTKYRNIYAAILQDNKKKVEDMLDKLAMQSVIIEECEEHLDAEGVVVPMQQGNYVIDRENPYVKILDRTTKTYQSIIKQLDDMMPKKEMSEAGLELMEFINRK